MILVSACLTGQACRYNGEAKPSEAVQKFLEGKPYITFCPEVMGGLAIPRDPAEIMSGGVKVISSKGLDVTDAFAMGAQLTLELADRVKAEKVILKEGSPSCGVHVISDGTFTKQRVKGMGLTTALLVKEGYVVYSEEEV